MWWAILGLSTIALGSYLYIRSNKLKTYWPHKGFVNVGENGGILTMIRKINPIDTDQKMYRILKERNQGFGGYYEFSQPAIIVKNTDIMRQILVKDFDHFVDHRDFHADEFTGKMLFCMTGEPWKELRAKMSPTFTTGKIRRMFQIVDDCSERFVNFLNEEIKETSTVNLVEGYGKYTVDVISSAAFGLESGAFREKKSIFENMAQRLTPHVSFWNIVKFVTIFTSAKLARLLNLKFFDEEAIKFFSSTIVSTINHRKTTGEKRDDFLQLMLEASAGQLKTEESELSAFEKEATVTVSPKSKVTLTVDDICAQSILFFLAGFETTQSLLQFATYQLAISPEIQQKLVDEVNESFKRNGGVFTYESIHEMEYMDKLISETLRMYPPVPRLDRTCTKSYTIPRTQLIIPAGTLVVMPSYAIHHDEEIYLDPFRFDPERFTKEAKTARNPYAYMPFGHGPRNCIGMRFALTESKLAIARLVHNFIIEPSEKTTIPVKFAFLGTLKPEGGMWLNLKRRKNIN